MYRSIKLYRKIDTLVSDEELWPICVPSYSRPNGQALRRLAQEDGLKLYLFIRAEQYDMYKQYADRYTIVKLKRVHNIGETRNAIVRYARKKGWHHLFMLDDDIQQLDFMVPSVTKNGVKAMRTWSSIKAQRTSLNKYAFKMWQYIVTPYLDEVAISTPFLRQFTWHPRYANAEPKCNVGQPIQCVHLNLDLLNEYDINYQSSDICGVEDYAITYECYRHGLKTLQIPDITYNCPAVGTGEGGCELNEEIAEERIRLFMENVVAPEDKHKFSIKTSKSGMKSVKFLMKYFSEDA